MAIVGHNGSGKSTLARHLNALLLPSEGDVWVDGTNTRDPRHVGAVRQTVGMVFQNPDNQIVATTVEDDVAFGAENLGLPTEEIEVRVDEALGMVGMLAFRLRSPHQLSSGQKQRVAIAGVLAMRPRCVVLDEATSLLDPLGRQDILTVVNALNRRGVTIVTITHSMREAAMANRVVVLRRGKVAMDGTPQEVFRQVERLRAMGLDVPPVVQLAHRVREVVPGFPADVLTVDDMVEAVQRLRQRQPTAARMASGR